MVYVCIHVRIIIITNLTGCSFPLTVVFEGPESQALLLTCLIAARRVTGIESRNTSKH